MKTIPLVPTCEKPIIIRTSGSKKRHVTVPADGFILPPMIIFKGKTNVTFRDIFVIVTQEKA